MKVVEITNKSKKGRGKIKNHDFGHGLTGSPAKNRSIRHKKAQTINQKRLPQAAAINKSSNYIPNKKKPDTIKKSRKLSTTPTAVRKRCKRAIDRASREKQNRKTMEKDMTARLKQMQKELKKKDQLLENLAEQLENEKKKKRKAQIHSAESTRQNKKIKGKLEEQKEYVDQLLKRL